MFQDVMRICADQGNVKRREKSKPTHCAVWRAENEPSLDVWEPAETL